MQMEERISKLRSRVAEIKIRMNNGISIVSFIKNAIYVSAGLTIMLKLNIIQSVIVSFLALLGFYVVGAVDIKWFKIMQEIAKLSSGKYNPYFKQKLGNLKK